jgi:hypothetical protein
VQRVEDPLPGEALDREALDVHGNVERTVCRSRDHRGEGERGGTHGQRRRHGGHQQHGGDGHDPARPDRGRKRTGQRLGDQHAGRRAQQRKPERARPDVQLLLDRGQTRVPGDEDHPVQEEDRGYRGAGA